MALFEDVLESSLGLGVLGLGAIILAPTVLPWVGRIARPIVKEVVKGGMYLVNSASAGISEVVSEATAEAHAEMSRPRSSVIPEPGSS